MSASRQYLSLQRNVSLSFLLWKSHTSLWLVLGLDQGKGQRKQRGRRKVWEWKAGPTFAVMYLPVKFHDSGRMINTLKNLI